MNGWERKPGRTAWRITSASSKQQAGQEAGQLAVEVISVTCCLDNRSHQVPDTEIATGGSRRGGYYRALCGHVLAAAPMVAPDGEPCQLCVAVRDRHLEPRRRVRRRHRPFG